MTKPLTRLAVPLLAAGLIALTGCSSGDDSDSGSYSPTESRADVQSDVQLGDRAENLTDADGDPGPAASQAPSTASENAPEKSGAGRTAPQDKAVISTGTVSLRSEDTEQARFDLQKVLDAHEGTIDEENTSTDDGGKVDNTRLVVRLPVTEFDQAMTDLAGVAELTGSSRSSEDVTTQVIDNDVRIRAQEKSLERIEVLLARASDIADIVSIEAQLSSRQAELDSLKSQQAYLRDQTSLSTITIHLEHEDATAKEKKDDDQHNAFVGGLLDGWNALTGFGAGLATVVGALLPFAVVIGLLGIPVLVLWRRLRTRPQSIAPPVASAE
ncbi:DUF4349 domain-containing protein [Nocardioides jensenii]|uniref:DUF4349 domain-containing protein n=1 Tax=Nocardioides jensenii TaxID=1843 RepID=UPI000836EC38|nr:DUF4349 domain-containing protein [Nocardioides jensenii]